MWMFSGYGMGAAGWLLMALFWISGNSRVDRCGGALPVAEVRRPARTEGRWGLQFKDNFSAKLVDSSGNGATEVLVDPPTGLVSIEYGPAMMWNIRYGMGAAWPRT